MAKIETIQPEPTVKLTLTWEEACFLTDLLGCAKPGSCPRGQVLEDIFRVLASSVRDKHHVKSNYSDIKVRPVME